MLKNAGKKIKTIATVIMVLSISISLAAAIGLIVAGTLVTADSAYAVSGVGMILGGVLIGLFGVLIAWIQAVFIYGFGELVDKVSLISNDLKYIKENR